MDLNRFGDPGTITRDEYRRLNGAAKADLEPTAGPSPATRVTRSCRGCGVVFEPRRSDQRFHDVTCRDRYHQSRKNGGAQRAIAAANAGRPVDAALLWLSDVIAELATAPTGVTVDIDEITIRIRPGI